METDYEITGDTMKFLRIKYASFISGEGMSSLLRLLSVDFSRWLCYSDSRLEGSGTLCIRMEDGTELRIPVHTEKTDDERYGSSYLMSFDRALEAGLAGRIAEYRKIIRSSERRSEERYDVGIERYADFGLKDSRILCMPRKKILPAVILNASVHGVLAMVTEPCGIFPGDPGLFLCCSFQDKAPPLRQPVMCVNAMKTDDGRFRLSFRFINPVSIEWQKKVAAYSDLLV